MRSAETRVPDAYDCRSLHRTTLRSMKELLAAEAELGEHGKGGKPKDPSAAMGSRSAWVRRGLAFWANLYYLEAKPKRCGAAL